MPDAPLWRIGWADGGSKHPFELVEGVLEHFEPSQLNQLLDSELEEPKERRITVATFFASILLIVAYSALGGGVAWAASELLDLGLGFWQSVGVFWALRALVALVTPSK